MCGIAGVVGEQYSRVESLLEGLEHRGPDARGTCFFDKVQFGLGHTRLSIIDLDDRSNQPMMSDCGDYVIAFNGEIYNYKYLRASLESLGEFFLTESDTEVLLKLLIRKGRDALNLLEGMFAFCFFDVKKRILMIARDHIGEKPMYYASSGSEFAFSSELRPLLALPWIDRSLDIDAIQNYLQFLYVPAPQTMFSGVRELEPGQMLVYDLADRRANVDSYFSLEDALSSQSIKQRKETNAAIFLKEFSSSVSSRTNADVPLGVFLSGGLDSNAIAAIMAEARKDEILAFTVGYSSEAEAEEYDESKIASQCALHFGMPHRLLEPQLSTEFIDDLHTINRLFGQPFGNPTALVATKLASVASQSRKVCLVGDGGDELLVGYPRYKALHYQRMFARIPKSASRVLGFLVGMFPENGKHATKIRRLRQFIENISKGAVDSYLSWVTYADSKEVRDALGRDSPTAFERKLRKVFVSFGSDPVRAATIVDFVSFVPFNLLQSADRTSMASSLELRAPFVGKRLVLAVLQMASGGKIELGKTKPMLARTLKDKLPKQVLAQRKKPFNPPMRTYIKTNIQAVKDLLGGPNSVSGSILRSILAPQFIDKQLLVFERGQRDNSIYLWGLCVLEIWLREFHEDGVSGQ